MGLQLEDFSEDCVRLLGKVGWQWSLVLFTFTRDSSQDVTHFTHQMAHVILAAFTFLLILLLSGIKGTKMSMLQAMYDHSRNLFRDNSRMMKLFYVKNRVSGVSEKYHWINFVLNTFKI